MLENDLLLIRSQLNYDFDEVIPKDIAEEYQIRIGMLHQGGGGDLGAQMILEMLRFLGYQRKVTPTKRDEIVWEEVEVGTAVIVAGRDKMFQRGEFRGRIGPGGPLAIKIDGDEWVQEVAPENVEISQKAPDELTDAEDAPMEVSDKRQIEEDDGVPIQTKIDPTDEIDAEEENRLAAIEEEEKKKREQSEIKTFGFLWDRVEAGHEVLVDQDGDTVAAKFIGEISENELSVEINGEEKSVATDLVHIV